MLAPEGDVWSKQTKDPKRKHYLVNQAYTHGWSGRILIGNIRLGSILCHQFCRSDQLKHANVKPSQCFLPESNFLGTFSTEPSLSYTTY